MKKEDLFQVLGEVEESFLDENVTEIKFISGWITAVVSIAACIAVSAGLIYLIPKPAENLRNPAEPVQTVLQAETSVQTVTETVSGQIPLINTEAVPVSPSYEIYISTLGENAEINRTAPETILDTIPYPEIEISIDEENGHVSMITLIDSNSLPHVGVLTKTESGYACQISGENFTLERIDENTLIMHEENRPWDNRTLKRCAEAVQPFAEIQTEDVKSVSIYDTPQKTIALSSEAVSEFMDILRNIKIYCKSLAHETGTCGMTVIRLQDDIVYKISPTQSFLLIDGMVYHADEASRKALAELYETYHQTEANETAVPETTAFSTETTANPANDMAVHLPYVTTEGETVPVPAVLPNFETERPPQEIITRYSETVPETTTTETITETIPESPQIPDYIQMEVMEEAGVLYSVTPAEFEPAYATQGIFFIGDIAEQLPEYYPDKKYCLAIEVHSAHEEISSEEAEAESLSDEQVLDDLGIQVLGRRPSDNVMIAIVTAEQIEQMREQKEWGFTVAFSENINFEQ